MRNVLEDYLKKKKKQVFTSTKRVRKGVASRTCWRRSEYLAALGKEAETLCSADHEIEKKKGKTALPAFFLRHYFWIESFVFLLSTSAYRSILLKKKKTHTHTHNNNNKK